jgi:alanyl-tRNA synthetase
MRHHTSTHVILGAIRRVLGEHAWQAGAEKTVNRSRLDISHWARITPDQSREIEKLANSVVMANMPVEVSWMAREQAERSYGYRLYQGGVTPGRNIRVVKIGDWDIEACGGTHLKLTGELGFIKILHTERIQDGVERIVFVSGVPAISHVQKMDRRLRKIAAVLNTPEEMVIKAAEDIIAKLKTANREIDELRRRLAEYGVEAMLRQSKKLKMVNLVTQEITHSDADFLITVANLLTKKEPTSVVALCSSNGTVRIVVMAGEDAVKAGIDAGKIASKMAKTVGGGGNGRPNFGQGGGTDVGNMLKSLQIVEGMVKRQLARE